MRFPIRESEAVAALMRPPQEVMRLARLGAFHQTRLSFGRTLVRRMARERWRASLARGDLDDRGHGCLIYRIDTASAPLSFVAVSAALAAGDRADGGPGGKRHTAFALVAGEVDEAGIARLRQPDVEAEAGRFAGGELVVSHADRSERLFDHVVDRLSGGRQPDLADLVKAGCLLRATAVHGNGKSGTAGFAKAVAPGVFSLPYQPEMLAIYMARQFSFDLVDHMARRRAPSAPALSATCKRALGIGHVTGFGETPFLIDHPKLLDAWITARETALARIRALAAEPAHCARFASLLGRASSHAAQWSTDDPRQSGRIALLQAELDGLRRDLSEPSFLAAPQPWDFLYRRAVDRYSLETQEMLASLLIELEPGLVDDLEQHLVDEAPADLDPAMRLGDLRSLIERRYDWAVTPGHDGSTGQAFGRGVAARHGAGRNEPLPVGIGARVGGLHRAVCARAAVAPEEKVAHFLLATPRWRDIVERVQSVADLPYAEVCGGLIGADRWSIDLLRCEQAILGAGKFDPRSDRRIRVTLFQGAPLIDELGDPGADDWLFPCFPC